MLDSKIIPPEQGGRGGSGWINTFTGKRFHPLDPDPELIDIRDIAHGLAAKARYAGHTREPYNVAQHSVIVSLHVLDRDQSLWGLLHDASEAYLPDVPKPLKILPAMAAYREAEARLMLAVCQRFGLDPEEPAIVKEIDRRMLPTEASQLFDRRHPAWRDRVEPLPIMIDVWSASDAERWFLERYEFLTGTVLLTLPESIHEIDDQVS